MSIKTFEEGKKFSRRSWRVLVWGFSARNDNEIQTNCRVEFDVKKNTNDKKIVGSYCCGIFHCVWNISASAGSINNQDCIFLFLRFIAFVHSYITIVLNILLKITMLTSFMVTTSNYVCNYVCPDYVCPAANRTWQRLTIISCDLTHERDTYFLNISHIIYLNYYLPRINRLQSKPLRLIKTNRVNSIIRHRMWLHA